MDIFENVWELGRHLAGCAAYDEPEARLQSLLDISAHLNGVASEVDREIVRLRKELLAKEHRHKQGGFVLVLSLLVIAVIACLLLVVCGAIATTPEVSLASLAPAQRAPDDIVLSTLPPFIAEAPILLAEAIAHAPREGDIPGIGHVIGGTHATDKHGEDALLAWDAMFAGGAKSFWKCRDGYTGEEKLYSINQIMKHLSDGTLKTYWTLSVLAASAPGVFAERTSFVTDQNGITTVILRDHCKNPWQMVHP